MCTVRLNKVSVKSDDRLLLSGVSLTIRKHQFWTVIGANGSGKSTLARLLCGRIRPSAGTIERPPRVESVTFEDVTAILDHERDIDDSNCCGGFDRGTTTAAFIFSHPTDPGPESSGIIETFGLSGLLDRGLKFLSTGEMRKALICRALVKAPRLLILDEPFDGLDAGARESLSDLITRITETGTQVVLLLNRLTEIPAATTHIAVLEGGRLVRAEETRALPNNSEYRETAAVQTPSVPPETRPDGKRHSNSSLVEMRHVNVRYRDTAILSDLCWEVRAGEQWMISGPNGSGKTTLLNLITGDNTQVYSNDVKLFGQQRGSGESVWEVKRRIGHISTAFQRDYRVGTTVIGAVLSGFFDSIGLYRRHSGSHIDIARRWLRLLKLEDQEKDPFQRLSFGQKRLVLLARAMVKQPQLLILDEPFQGLDDDNRRTFLKLCQQIGTNGHTHLLYATHNFEDRIPCINRHLKLVPAGKDGFTASSFQV